VTSRERSVWSGESVVVVMVEVGVIFGISILLGKGHGVVGTKRGVTAEENVRDNGCT